MKMSTWRPKLSSWLNKNITVTSWVLDRPETIPETTGFLPPLKDVEYVTNVNKDVYIHATQDFFVLKRFGAEFTYKDLPVNQMEGITATLAYRILLDYGAIDLDVIEMEVAQISNPVRVEEIAEGDGDWLLELAWSFKFKALVDPETPIVPDWLITTIKLHVWRDDLSDDTTDGTSDPNLRTLDWEHTTT